eukprot:TRINITY_DN61993_c0_g1_i1.p1 TRINITY_DN61993_c0_g1~~TRINITY_DN61993_c0_g1_i1.p1  ORF type:complete len:341 (-),score=54.10 TRINITY_DN61993_c0_g1_i1:65-1087(-)
MAAAYGAPLPPQTNYVPSSVECRLESAHDLASLLTALQLREREQKDQRVHCEASPRGLKFAAQSCGKDVAILGWMFSNSFKEYKFTGTIEEIHLKLPAAPFLSCLQIFSDRAALMFRYPSDDSGDLHFTLEEDAAVTECRLRTLVLEEAPEHIAFFSPEDELRHVSVFRPTQPEAWYQALSEFEGIDAPDIVLRVTLRAADSADAGQQASVILRAQTITSDAEVEMQRGSLDEFSLSPEAAAEGEVSHKYLLSSVLSSCLRAAKDAKAVKVRFNSEGVMSSQFILRSRGQRDQLFCEALVCPIAEIGFPGGAPFPAGMTATATGTSKRHSFTQDADSTTF